MTLDNITGPLILSQTPCEPKNHQSPSRVRTAVGGMIGQVEDLRCT